MDEYIGLVYNGKDMSDRFLINKEGKIKSVLTGATLTQHRRCVIVNYHGKSIRINIDTAGEGMFGLPKKPPKSLFSEAEREEILVMIKAHIGKE